MRRGVSLVAVLLAAPAPPAEEVLVGFTPAASAEQRDLERRYDALLRADNLREWMQRLSARPHAVGSAYGRENARFLLAQFQAWGYEARLEEFEVLFPTPKERVLEMVAPTRFRAGLGEPALSLNFAPLRNARRRLEESARRYDQALDARLAEPRGIPPETQQALDALLVQAERTLTRPEGLPGRSWFRHLVYAPGFYTGYGVKTLPGVREALERRSWSLADEQTVAVASALEALAAHLDRATALLAPPERP